MDSGSTLIGRLAQMVAPVMTFIEQSEHAKVWGDPSICDFVYGNPHDMPLPGLVDALERHTRPKDKDWFAYKFNEEPAQRAVASSLAARFGASFLPEDVFLTPGAFGALSVAFRSVCDPGDEVIFISPPWFFYEPMIALAGATPVRVSLNGPAFDLDVESIAAAITPRTRAVLVNTPHNPTGRIYPREQLESLASLLRDASARNGRRIFWLSDESYNHILYDGRGFETPATMYDDTLLLYTYGKTLLAPGERIGYIALAPGMSDKDGLRGTIMLSQVLGGWQFPNATLQRALPDLERESIDIGALQRRRDRLGGELRDMGYDPLIPEGTFYMMVPSPIPDDMAFTSMLASNNVYVGPGTIFELPGWFRISLTANDDMVERSLPGFRAAIEAARA